MLRSDDLNRATYNGQPGLSRKCRSLPLDCRPLDLRSTVSLVGVAGHGHVWGQKRSADTAPTTEPTANGSGNDTGESDMMQGNAHMPR